MHVTLVHVEVKPEHIDDFIQATKLNQSAAILEPGNRRFDVLQSADNSSHFILYEAYENEHFTALHKSTDHYLNWRNKVSDWMAAPRKGIQYSGIFPSSEK